jgi:hypothetical protein
MSYWGSKPTDNDYAFDGVGAYVYLIKTRMLESANRVIEKSYPEQDIIASLQCLRLLAGAFPKCVRVSFGKKEFQESKAAFTKWYDLVKDKLPSEYREAILKEANDEFELFAKQVLHI